MTKQESEELLAAIDRGIREGVAAALRRHKLAGIPIHVERDGKIVEIAPEDITGDVLDDTGDSLRGV